MQRRRAGRVQTPRTSILLPPLLPPKDDAYFFGRVVGFSTDSSPFRYVRQGLAANLRRPQPILRPVDGQGRRRRRPAVKTVVDRPHALAPETVVADRVHVAAAQGCRRAIVHHGRGQARTRTGRPDGGLGRQRRTMPSSLKRALSSFDDYLVSADDPSYLTFRTQIISRPLLILPVCPIGAKPTHPKTTLPRTTTFEHPRPT